MSCAHRLGLWAVLRLKPPKPQLEDGSVYRQNRPTQLDKTKNLHFEVHWICGPQERSQAPTQSPDSSTTSIQPRFRGNSACISAGSCS